MRLGIVRSACAAALALSGFGCARTAAAPAPSASASSAPAATSAPSSAPASAGACVRVWAEPDAVFRYKSMYEELTLDRAKRTLTEKVSSWSAPKSVVLSDAEAADLDAALGALCLPEVRGEPPPPPGGPLDAKITTAKNGTRALGVRRLTGGDFYALGNEEWSALFVRIKRMSPEHRNCLPLGKDGVVVRGELMETTRRDSAPKNPGAKYKLLSLADVTCVAPEGATPLSGPPVVTAGSIELRPDGPALASLLRKKVVATGRLSTEAGGGDHPDVIMTTSAVRAE